MNMITRCPACETMFKVVPDQLRISAGWVRCGQCNEIFDASSHLLDAIPTELSPASAVPAPVVELAENAPPAPVFTEPVLLPELSVPKQLSPLDSPNVQTVGTDSGEVVIDRGAAGSPVIEVDEVTLNSESLMMPTNPDARVVGVDVPKVIDEAVKGEPVAFSPPVESISFLANDNQGVLVKKSIYRGGLVVLSVCLVFGLIFQGVYRERLRLSAWEPRLSPWFERACEVLGCSLGPLLKIDSISVDSSTFAKLRADTYRLSFSLKNSATMPVAFPAIELTLTDALDRPFLRRVLRASDLGIKDTFIVAGAERPVSIDITVQSAAALPDRVAGYRLVAFYP